MVHFPNCHHQHVDTASFQCIASHCQWLPLQFRSISRTKFVGYAVELDFGITLLFSIVGMGGASVIAYELYRRRR